MLLLDICVNIILLLVAFNLKYLFKEFSAKDRKYLDLLLLFHIAISIFFHFYIVNSGGDATNYWETPKEWSLQEIWDIASRPSGTGMMYLINYIPSNTLQLSFFTGNMLYSFFGFIGFVYLFRLIKLSFAKTNVLSEIKLFNVPLFPWVFFLPNFHFWTSGIGKDALLFTTIILVFFSLKNFKEHLVLMGLSCIVMLAIRPHMFLFIVVAFMGAYILEGHLKAYQKGFVALLLVGALIVVLPYVMEFVQLESLETEVIENYTSDKASNLNRDQTGSGVDISGYPFPLKLFTFLYRPLFFDINGILAILSSFENFILVLLSFSIFRKKPISAFKKSHRIIKGGIIFFLLGSSAFSLILGNLGIMLRQKNMLMPWLILFVISVYYQFLNKPHINENSNSY